MNVSDVDPLRKLRQQPNEESPKELRQRIKIQKLEARLDMEKQRAQYWKKRYWRLYNAKRSP
jgi:hypothetical protein